MTPLRFSKGEGVFVSQKRYDMANRNIIDAIIEIVKSPKYKLKEYSASHNRANAMGEALEEYIKDAFAGTIGEDDAEVRNRALNKTFSYLGNQNNPPDSMLKDGGDAIEVKKIESANSSLALNSSYPKAKLFSNSTMISNACRDCEKWTVRDMIYAVGVIRDNNLKSLALVYGSEYCADKTVYEKIRTAIKDGVERINGIEFAETNELGRVNRVDPLGITYLRVRGMWHIENPFVTFDYLYRRNETKYFTLMAIINEEKTKTFSNFSELVELSRQVDSLRIEDKEIKDPNNPAKLHNVKLITFTV